MIEIKHKGDFSLTERFLNRIKNQEYINRLEVYAQEGLQALIDNTPRDSGLTADSWNYKIKRGINTTTIEWFNTNINDGVPIAIILQYGHGTGTGGYVQGIDYINPAMKPVFDNISNSIWKEVIKE